MESNNEIVLYQSDSTVSLEVRVEDETVWLTHRQMSELFQRERSVITRHNIQKEQPIARPVIRIPRPKPTSRHAASHPDQNREWEIKKTGTTKSTIISIPA